MGVNRGKDFENLVKSQIEILPDVSIDRLHDQTTGFKGSKNICDFIVYKYPHQYYIECKSCYGNTLNFHNITDRQWNGLLEKSKIRGVIAGYIVWFIDRDLTVFVTADCMRWLKDTGSKSLSYDVANSDVDEIYKINGKKKRVFFEYDFTEFFNRM